MAAALIADPALHTRLSHAARSNAVTRFCSSLVIPEDERYYQEICAA